MLNFLKRSTPPEATPSAATSPEVNPPETNLSALSPAVQLAQVLLDHSRLPDIFSVSPPAEVALHLDKAQQILNQVKQQILQRDQDLGVYFETSSPRYVHYWAAAMSLPVGASVLDVGSAPGHVDMGLYQLGYQITGINLSESYRSLYPDPIWLERLELLEHNVEQANLPFADDRFDAVLFTEVLEHIAIRPPQEVLADLYRILKPGGLLILSTPNVCNISNLYALMQGMNIFWTPDIFYGSLDRHNREYAPQEVYDLVTQAHFKEIHCYGINSHCNWRGGGHTFAYEILSAIGDNHPLLRNTIMIVARK